jgi:hypothetical protein
MEMVSMRHKKGVDKMKYLLRHYFSVPSVKNFTPYKTGQNIHFMFSALSAVLVVWGCSNLFALSGVVKGIIAFGSVLLFWGAGAAVGTLSHHFILLSMVCVGGIMAVLIKWPGMIPPLVYGACAHVVLNKLIKRVNPLNRPSEDPDTVS